MNLLSLHSLIITFFVSLRDRRFMERRDETEVRTRGGRGEEGGLKRGGRGEEGGLKRGGRGEEGGLKRGGRGEEGGVKRRGQEEFLFLLFDNIAAFESFLENKYNFWFLE